MPSTLALPYDLASTIAEFRFESDATVGVKMTRIRHLEGGAFDHTTGLDDPAFVAANLSAAELDGRLWEAVVKLSSGGEVKVGPANAASFAAHNMTTDYASGRTVIQFRWDGIAVAGAEDSDTLWVQITVELGATDRLARFRGWIGRKKGSSCIIEKFVVPVLWLKGIATKKAAETNHIDGQKRTRVLTPANFVTANSLFSQNTPLWWWCQVNDDKTQRHPNIFQNIQLAALAGMNPELSPGVPDPAYRRMLYVQTEDARFHYKDFRYRGLNYTTANEGWFNINVTHIPGYERALGQVSSIHSSDVTAYDASVSESRMGNEYVTPYATAIGPLTAKNSAWYFDAAELYRDWAVSAGYVPARLDLSTELKSTYRDRDSFFCGFSHFAEVDRTVYHLREVTITDYIKKALENPYIGNTKGYVHTQKVIPNHDVGSPDSPIAASVDPGLAAAIALANSRGYVYSFYISGIFLLRSSSPKLAAQAPRQAQIITFNGEAINAEDWVACYGRPEARTFMPSVTAREAAGLLDARGLYADQISGQDFRLCYGPGHVQHGGNYHTLGKRELIRNLRNSQIASGGADLPPAGTGYMAFSEITEETLAGLMDFTQIAYHWYPGHFALAEEATVPTGVSDYPWLARDMSVPFWNLVWHEYQIANYFPLPWTSYPMAAGAGAIYPVGGFPGLTQAEWRDLQCFSYASLLAGGCRTAYFWYLWDFDRPLMQVDPATLALFDPTGTGTPTTVADFIRQCFQAMEEAYAGQFLVAGRMMRPAEHDPATNTKVANPAADLDLKVRPQDAQSAYPYFYEQPGFSFGIDTFDVPAVFHSMWRSPGGTIGMILVNWTNAAATWNGTFDPSLYGLAATYDCRRLNQGAASTLIGNFTGAQTIGNGLTINIGTVPARTIRVFTFTP